MSRILLAPMEGLADPLMRGVLTALGGYDWGICEFIRVTESVLPNRTFLRTCPELLTGSLTDSGTSMRVQLLGSDPHFMAANAARLVKHRPAGIDINFGCPAPTVFRHRGGSALLGEPDLLHEIVSAVRAVVPADLPFTAKMRLGIADASLAVECAQAIAAGGADELIIHGRTKVDGYKPPARWAEIDRVRAAVNIPIIANGEVWTAADFRQCQIEHDRSRRAGRPVVAAQDPRRSDRWLGRGDSGARHLLAGGTPTGAARPCRWTNQAVADAAAPALSRGRAVVPASAPGQGR